MKTEYLNNKDFEKAIRQFQKSKRDKSRYELIIEDLNISCKKRQKNNKQPFCDIELFRQEQIQAIREFDKAQQNLTSAFYALSQNLVRYAKDIITDIDDAIQEGVMICFEKIDRFNPEKGKAFNYMTTCIINHYRQIYRTTKNYKLFKEKYKEYVISKLSSVFFKNGKENYSQED